MVPIVVALAAPVVKLALEKVLSFVSDEGFAFYHAKDEIKRLGTIVPEIQDQLAKLEDDRLDPSSTSRLKNWFENLRVAAYDAEDLLYTWTTKYQQWNMKKEVEKLHLPFSMSNTSFQYLESRKLKKIIARLDTILEDGKCYGNQTKGSRAPVSPETGDLLESSEPVVSREEDKQEIIRRLITDEESSNGENYSFIPIVGMGGLGKTTLAQLVFQYFEEKAKNDKPNKHFDIRTWVSVTKNFDIKKILTEIILSNKSEEDMVTSNVNSSIGLLQKDASKTVTGKKFLIVLDDLWATDNHEDMKNLEAVLRLGGKGSRVLVTSRNQGVSKQIRLSKSPYHLQCLGDNESWSMFEEFAFRKDGGMTARLRQDLEIHGKKIVRKCKGLPLAIKQMAGLLSGVTDVARWRDIESSQTWEVEDSDYENNYNVLSALRLSYNHLPSSVHKQCFAYCSLFPKAHVYEVDELVKLWMAEGFIEHKKGQRTEDIGRGYFEKLSDRFFFECTSTDDARYRMHDLIHDLAQLISFPFYRQVVEMEDIKSFDKKSRHVSLVLSEEVEQPTSMIISKSKKLRTLLFPVERFKTFGRAHSDIFSSLVYVRVLDLSSSTLETLPDSIGEMKLVHYLDISKTEVKKLPDSICNLYHLQTLKLWGCPWIFSLPKKIKMLVNLRHLELDEMFWYKASTFPPSMGCLTNLHNLHKFQVGRDTGYKLEELKNMKYLTGRLHISNLENAVNAGKEKTSAGEGNTPQVNAEEANLKGKERIEKVEYEWSDSTLNLQNEAIEKKVLEDLKPQPRIKELRICHYRGSEFPSWIGGGQLQDLVTLVLTHCERVKILSLGELPHLREVHLESMLELEEWQEEGYESLDLEKIEEENYQPLRRLTVSNCPKLTKLPCCFSKLYVLKITKCEKLETIPFGPMSFITLEKNAVMKHWGDEIILEGHNESPQEVMFQNFLNNFLNFLEEHDESISSELEEDISEGQNESAPRELEEVISEGQNESILRELEEVISEGHIESIPRELEVITEGHNEPRRREIQRTISVGRNVSTVIFQDFVRNFLNFLEGHEEPIPRELEEVISEGHNETIPRELEEVISEGHNEPTQRENYSLRFSRENIISLFSSRMINLKIVKCPAMSTLPGGLHPQKLEISGCSSLTALPDENCAGRLTLLALDSCQGDTLLGMIPSSPKLLSLMISNISDVRCLPTFPGLPRLQTLHIHDCPDLEYFSTAENRLFERFTSLDILSIKNCPKLVTLPAEGLPTSIRYLSIGPCESLNSFGLPDVLVKLDSLCDLYIEDCPELQSLPDNGLPASLLHLSIKGCPSLIKSCAEGGSYWPKIKDISDLEIETPSSSSSSAWYSLSRKRRGHNSKGKKVLE